MAKRSARKERQRETRAPAPPTPATPSSALMSRPFWLGVLVAACVLVPVAVVAVILAGGGDEGLPTPGARASVTPSASDVAQELKQADDDRNKTQVTELTALMRQYAEDLDPAVSGVNQTLPPERDDEVGRLASARDADEWIEATQKAAAFFDETVSGNTDTNVARGALATAVRGLAQMTQTYRLAIEQPQLRRELLERTRALRDDAMGAWETAAIQVDVINIAAGFGHQHPPRPGGAGTPPDDLPEGTGATEG